MSKIGDLTDKLRELLASGTFLPGARFPSEYELQERFGVSRMTANKAVSLLVAEGLLTRGVRGSGTYVNKTANFPKGWIAAIEEFEHPYNMGMIAGAAQEAFARGYMLSVFRPNLNGMGYLMNSLIDSDCLGVLGTFYQFDAFPADFPKPVICLDSGIEPGRGRQRHSVTCDNYGAAHEMMSKILNSGKKNAVMLGIESSPNRRCRMQGFADAMNEYGMADADKRKYLMHHGSKHEVKLALQKILRQRPDVDFIATDSDDIVFRIMQVWESEGFDWAGRIGLSGFGTMRQNMPSLMYMPDMSILT